MTSSHSVPAETRARRPSASMSTPFMRDVLSRIVSCKVGERPALCPVPCGATRRPLRRACSTIATTSSALSGKATKAGFWSWAKFQGRRAWSQLGIAGSDDEAADRVRDGVLRS